MNAILTPEEQAQMLDLQNRLIELLVDRGAAMDLGDQTRAGMLQDEIDDLQRQRDHIRLWAAAAAK